MMRQLEYPAVRLSKIRNQVENEKNQTLIGALNGAFMRAAFQGYIPDEDLPKFKNDIADFWLQKAKKEKADTDLQRFCVEKGCEFISSKELLTVAAQWIEDEKVTIDKEELKCELRPIFKYMIIKKYWANTEFTLEQKQALRDKLFAKDDSDAANECKKVIEWSLPDAKLKEQLWNEITDPESKDPLKTSKLKMEAFMKIASQPDLMKPYYEKYLAILPEIVEKRDREFAQTFCNNLTHAVVADEKDEAAFQGLLDKKLYGSEHFFTQFLKRQVEQIDISKKAKKLCKDYLAAEEKK